ncbi:MAG: 2-dehydro-3-deoxyglucarate aldolase [Candidatus Latescibacteria bacterium]|nr:2-dehydro-3-deoxyglucarate aldolase [Candidatus Latescibacterota bacterium]
MKHNIIKEKLSSGKPVIGAWISSVSSISAEFMAHVGFDFLIVDTEHSHIGFESTVHCFQAICTTETVPIARVAWNDQVLIKRLLDAGAMGLIVPMVNSPEEAERAVRAMKYPPKGNRSLAGCRAVVYYGDDYYQKANDEIAVIVQIEHPHAVKQAREILAVKGIDSCFVGPRDLAGLMGVPMGHPDHEAAIAEVVKAGKTVGTPVGINCLTLDDVNQRLEQGFQFVAVGSDLTFAVTWAKSVLAQLKVPK